MLTDGEYLKLVRLGALAQDGADQIRNSRRREDAERAVGLYYPRSNALAAFEDELTTKYGSEAAWRPDYSARLDREAAADGVAGETDPAAASPGRRVEDSAVALVDYTRPRAVSMSQPAMPLTAVTIGIGTFKDDDEVWEHGRPVLSLVAMVEDEYERPRRGEWDMGEPAVPPTPETLKREGYRPKWGRGVHFDYLVEGEFGPGLFLRDYAEGANTVYDVVPTASLPLPSDVRAEMVRKAREKTAHNRAHHAQNAARAGVRV